MGLATPTKRKPGVKLTKEQKRNNRMLNRLRSVVERVIAPVLHLACFAFWVSASVGLVWAGVFGGAGVDVFGCGTPLMNKPRHKGFRRLTLAATLSPGSLRSLGDSRQPPSQQLRCESASPTLMNKP